MNSTRPRTSAEETVERFDTPEAAAKYARSLGGTATHRREMRCILRGLAGLQQGACVLDLPCGTGRLLPELAARGFNVTEADSSPHMVEQARLYARRASLEARDDQFRVASVFESGFADDSFDAVVCNRLMHHFREPDIRVKALEELRRICRGPIVASFFCNLSFDAAVFHARQKFKGTPATDRIPIWRSVFADDIRRAGLKARRWIATRPGISKQWYVVMQRG